MIKINKNVGNFITDIQRKYMKKDQMMFIIHWFGCKNLENNKK